MRAKFQRLSFVLEVPSSAIVDELELRFVNEIKGANVVVSLVELYARGTREPGGLGQ